MSSSLASNSDRGSEGDPDSTGAAPDQTQWFQLGVICAASFVVWSGFGAILPYLPVFLQEQAHASVWLIGAVAASYYAGTFVSSAPLGRLSDSIGRKPMIVAGVGLYSVATLLFVSTTHPGWFVLFRLLEGVGAGAVTPAGHALVAELTTETTRGRAYGWLTTSQFGGLVAGPVLAWPLYSLGGGQGTWAFYTIFLFGSALSAVTAVVLLFTIKEPEHARRRRTVKVRRPPYRQLVTRPVLAFLVVSATGHFAMGSSRCCGACGCVIWELRCASWVSPGSRSASPCFSLGWGATWPIATVAGRSCSRGIRFQLSRGSATASLAT